ncbi:Scavenger receptor cysteine-rich type 1 protein M130 [Liparis tanakae]|uniref:Scavenger receptor cysteine-rich type 1 protein M130 n=1 Tax=Liparis tanakae TaxID=230148 RepID=A0A4Z2FLV2_9TELE|nr:Scavenger receptor cysteine-rich type 1 protein M130 [Liparis tanakae]
MRAVRLTGGLDRCSGRVEVHRHGLWGSVCDNCWNRNMAAAVCSMLRCGAKPQKFSQFLPPLALGAGPLWFYECDGNARTLWQCTEYVNQTHLCVSSKASGLVCEALCFQQTRSSFRPPTYELHHNSYRGAVDLVEVAARPLPPEDSKRNRAEPLTTPSGPNSLWEEPPEPTEEVMGVFTRCNPAAAHYARVSRPSVDSLDTCSTSSGDTNHGYVQVTADPGPAQSSGVSDPRDPSKLVYAEAQLSRGQNTDLQNSGDEDDGPVYSLVSPDRDSAPEDDYDDIDVPK